MAYIGQEPGLGQAQRSIFTAVAVTDTVTADDDGLPLNYTVGQVSVYLNGVKQVVGTDVTCDNGSTVVFAANYAIGDVVEVIALSTFSPADTVPATGGTFSGNVIMGANLTVSGTTTTIDTAVTVSDAMVINNAGSDVGLKINSTSTGNIVQLQDGGVDQLVIADGGAVTVTGDTTHNGNVIMATNKKVQQKGAFMQSSTHQALTLGG